MIGLMYETFFAELRPVLQDLTNPYSINPLFDEPPQWTLEKISPKLLAIRNRALLGGGGSN